MIILKYKCGCEYGEKGSNSFKPIKICDNHRMQKFECGCVYYLQEKDTYKNLYFPYEVCGYHKAMFFGTALGNLGISITSGPIITFTTENPEDEK